MDSSLYFGGAIVLGAFLWFFCAYLCYITAPKKHRRPITWLILGILFGPFAFAALYLMPKGNLAPAGAASGSSAHGTATGGGSGGAGSASSAGHEHGGSGHGHETQSQADLYEVPNKHKH